MELVGIVSVSPKLRDILLEDVVRAPTQIVLNHHVVGGQLSATVRIERNLKCLLVGHSCLPEIALFVNVGSDKMQFQCRHHRRHLTVPLTLVGIAIRLGYRE